MEIVDLFRLSNGRTVFTGLVSGHSGLIGRCHCQLRSSGELRQAIAFEGEQIVKRVDAANALRAIGTLEHVDLSVQEAQSGEWKLICST